MATRDQDTNLYLRDVSLKLGSGLVAFLMSFASGVVVARVLGTEGNGLAALIILIPTMIASFGSLGIDKANGYLAGADKVGAQVLLENSLFLALAISLVAGGISWLVKPLVTGLLPIQESHTHLLMLAMVIVPLSLVEMYLQGILWGLGRIAQISLVSIGRFASQLALNLVLVALCGLGVTGGVIAAILTPALCIVLYLVFLRKVVYVRLGYHTQALGTSLAFGLQAHLGNVLQFLNYRLDVFIVSYFTDVSNVGLYIVSVSLAELMWHVPNAFGFVLFPKISASDPETAQQFTPKVARISCALTTLAAACLVLVCKPMISVLYTKEYLPSIYPLLFLLPGVIALSISKIIFSDLGGRGTPRYGAYASLASLFVTVGLDVLLIPRWGIVGAAIASSLAYTTNAVLAIVFYRRISGNKLADVLFIRRADIKEVVHAGLAAIVALDRMVRTQRFANRRRTG
jgi:O-antigen/teichoic acid export membrane protein